jgi:cytochrome b involved in lipid metabolism
MKKLIGGLFVTLLFIGAGCNTQNTPTSNQKNDQKTPVTNNQTTTTPDTAGGTKMYEQYTMEDIKAANTPEKCWTVIRGTVYDLTSWIEKHPGGERGILSLCGTDGTAKYTGKHGGQAGPEKALEGFEIGKLK